MRITSTSCLSQHRIRFINTNIKIVNTVIPFCFLHKSYMKLVYVIKIKTSIPPFHIFQVKIIKIEIFWCQFKLRALIANHNLKKRYFKRGTFEDDWPNFKMSTIKKTNKKWWGTFIATTPSLILFIYKPTLSKSFSHMSSTNHLYSCTI